MNSLQLFLIFLCLIGNAFFAGIETGLISINRLKLRPHVEEEEPWALLIQNFLDNPGRLLSTTLVGTNLCMIMGSILAANVANNFSPHAGEWIAGILMTTIVLVACEYSPKAWFRAHPIARTRLFVRALDVSSRVLGPPCRLIMSLTNWIVPEPAGQAPRAPVMSREDLVVLTKESTDSGLLTPKQRIMILRVADLSETTAPSCMIPLAKMTMVRETATVAEFYRQARESNYSNIPVYSDEKKQFVGLVNLYDVIPLEPADSATPVSRFMKSALFVKYNAPLTELFPLMRRARQSVCLVTGARGEVVGLLTSEDILKLIVGSL
ncbi:MAG: CNNM domain-containing protein [Kiritimatiellia bacterium]